MFIAVELSVLRRIGFAGFYDIRCTSCLCFGVAAHVYKAWMQDPSSLQVSYFPSGPLLHLVKLIGVVDAPSRGEQRFVCKRAIYIFQ